MNFISSLGGASEGVKSIFRELLESDKRGEGVDRSPTGSRGRAFD